MLLRRQLGHNATNVNVYVKTAPQPTRIVIASSPQPQCKLNRTTIHNLRRATAPSGRLRSNPDSH